MAHPHAPSRPPVPPQPAWRAPLHGLFITGTDTGVGKTRVTAALLQLLAGAGWRVGGLKPVAAGLEPSADGAAALNEDVALLARAGNALREPALVGPLQLAEACAPHIAARLAGRRITPDAVHAGVRRAVQALCAPGGDALQRWAPAASAASDTLPAPGSTETMAAPRVSPTAAPRVRPMSATTTAPAAEATAEAASPSLCASTAAPVVAPKVASAVPAGPAPTALLVEGVGGFAVPLADDDAPYWDTADLAHALQLPLLLVVGLRLGCLNHALLTAEAIAARGLRLAGWVANRAQPEPMAHEAANLATLAQRLAQRHQAPCWGLLSHHPADATGVAAAAQLDANAVQTALRASRWDSPWTDPCTGLGTGLGIGEWSQPGDDAIAGDRPNPSPSQGWA